MARQLNHYLHVGRVTAVIFPGAITHRMFSIRSWTEYERFALLSREATADRETACRAGRDCKRAPVGSALAHAGGRVPRLMRVMQTNACSLSLLLPDSARASPARIIGPEEAARTFMEAHRAGAADGLFLTSGVPGRPRRAMDRMLATAEVLRRREAFSATSTSGCSPAPMTTRCGQPCDSRAACRSTSKGPPMTWSALASEGPLGRSPAEARAGGQAVPGGALEAGRPGRAGRHDDPVRRRRPG